jgi:serine/threonine protein kinase
LERDVAIKLIHIYKLNDPLTIDRFQREAKVVAALRHPGIVQVYDFDIEENLFYMVMEYVQGENLAHRLERIEAQDEKIPLNEVLRLFRLITEAVAYAHNQGVIHCDLKPENVMLTPQGQPVLTDFGISKFISGERLTGTNDILGTPYYMSPEQGTGRGRIDARSDIYALGVILYELTTGRLPFSGETYMSIVFKHINELPTPPRHLNPNLPPGVEQIIEKAMAKNPDQRYASAQELLEAIQGLATDKPPVAGHETGSLPSPALNPPPLKTELVVPGGALILRDKFYIERVADAQLKEQIIKWGATITIRAPRQTGKTSLLMRGIQYAREQQHKAIFLDLQSFSSDQLASLDSFLYEVAVSICDELDLDEATLDEAWSGSRSATKKLTRFMEQAVLTSFNQPIILAMDEADFLLQTDFYKDVFGLLRSWHNRRASHIEWEKLNLVLVISTEPYLLIDDIHQSPFNVGLHISLNDFDENQVGALNSLHGLPIAQNDLPQFVALLNGQPFLTRLALFKMITEGLTWAELSHQAASNDGPFGDHLRHQYWIIYDKPELKTALRDIILTNCCPDERALFRLLQAGLIKGSGDAYTCRCELYKLYFADKLV